ncbi:hypothetical protein ABT330_33000 [Streptomyces sp. NPDC000658]|uniref:hypothetical protein n=1 Tax=Streptomyces sp. NPDC000658 TaxID=3154266 RepID=UPI00331B8C0E
MGKGKSLMQTAFWSRRRGLGALVAGTAVAAASSVPLPVAAAAAGAAGADPVPLPGAERAETVGVRLTGGKGVKSAATDLSGADAENRAFLAVTPPQRTVQDSRLAPVRIRKGLSDLWGPAA